MTATVTPALLEVTGLTIRSRRTIVIRDLSFTVEQGSLLWITGENGAGKSSLLRVLAGRAGANASLRFRPALTPGDIGFYSPQMEVPLHTTVASWLKLHTGLRSDDSALLRADDALLPQLDQLARLSRLSTGEAKRLLLWALLRTPKPYTFLDEPYEHLSPSAKSRLTEILLERARGAVVVVATNQDVPIYPGVQILRVENL